jgi:hypothetical protein
VVDQGAGLNIVCNVAMFNFETILKMISGYHFRVFKHKIIAMVRVPRATHILLFKHNKLLKLFQSIQMARFLLNRHHIEEAEHACFARMLLKLVIKEAKFNDARLFFQ